MSVEYDVAGLTSLLECGGGITGVGWPTLTSMVKNMISTQNCLHQKLNGAIFERQISGGGDSSCTKYCGSNHFFSGTDAT